MSKRISLIILASLIVLISLFTLSIIYNNRRQRALDTLLRPLETLIITSQPSQKETTMKEEKTATSLSSAQTSQQDKTSVPVHIEDIEKSEYWQVTISNVDKGKYNYNFLIDGEQKVDPINSSTVTTPDNNNFSLFSIPFTGQSAQPKYNSEGNIIFNFYGEIKNNGRIAGDFNDWEWSTEEFEPVNEKAKDKWSKITSDEKLGKLSGRVIDGNGNGISGAVVLSTPFRDRGMGSRTAKTDSAGNFEISYVYPGTYMFIAKAEGFAKTRARGFPQTLNQSGKIENIQIVLSKGGSISGIVLDEKSKPVSNTIVRINNSGRRGGFRNFPFSNQRDSFITKDDGKFIFSNLSTGYYNVDATHQDFANAAQNEIFLAEGQNRDDIRVILTKGLSLKGQVVDTEDKPLASVKVEAMGIGTGGAPRGRFFGGWQQSPLTKTAVSDDKGNFTLTNLSYGTVSVNGNLEGYYRTERVVIELEEGKEPQPVKIVLEKGGYITGIVLTPEKKPVPDATVWIKGERASANRRYNPMFNVQSPAPDNFNQGAVKTNEEGKFTIEKLSKQLSYRVAAKSPDYAETSVEDVKADGQEITIVLKVGGSISGRVYVIDTEEPVKDATLTTRSGNRMDSTFLTTNSKEDGRYEFDNVPEGMYNISITAGEYLARDKRNISVQESQAVPNVDFAVYKGLTASGKVTDILTERPIPGATVRAFVSDEQGRGMSGQNSVTDSEGNFTITNLLAERTYFSASAEGYTENINSIRDRGYYDLTPGQVVNDILIKLNPGLVVSGNVADTNNNPVSGASVQLQGSNIDFRNRFLNAQMSCYSQTDGQYIISNVPQNGGKFYLTASHPDYSTTQTNEFTIDKNNPTHQETIVLKKGIIISGRVTNGKDEPIPNAMIRVDNPQIRTGRFGSDSRTSTNSDGLYRLQNLPEGNLSVVAGKEGMAREVKKDITVKDGDVITDLNFILEEGMILSGLVVDDLNNPLSDVAISAANTSGGDGRGRTFSDSKGQFTIDTLDEGKYRIDATYNLTTSSGRSRFFIRIENVDAGTDDITFVFEINGSMRGRVVSAVDSRPIEKYKLSATKIKNLQGQGGSDNQAKVFNISNIDGEFLLKNLESGFYNVEITAEDFNQHTTNDIKVVSPEETSNIIIELKKGGTISGKVVSGINNTPISGAKIKLVKYTNGEPPNINFDSDAEGNFEKPNVEEGKYKVIVSKQGYQNKQINEIIIGEGQRINLGLIVLTPAM